jgi:hypothetical protein
MKTLIDTYGYWYCGRLTLTRGLWQIGFAQDLTSYKVGFSIGRIHVVELTVLCWSVDLVKMTLMDAAFYEYDHEMRNTPLSAEWEKVIKDAMADLPDAIRREKAKESS